MLREVVESNGELSDGLKKEVIKLIKEIVKTTDGLKAKAEKLDEMYKKETGKSFFFQYVNNNTPITSDDITFIKNK